MVPHDNLDASWMFSLCSDGNVLIQTRVLNHHSKSDKLKETKSQRCLGGAVTRLSLLCNNQ